MKTALPSNRSFGWTFAAVFVLGGAYNHWQGGAWHAVLLVLGCVAAVVTLTRQSWLTPLNRAWMAFGDLLGRVVSPVVLGAIFFCVFTPAGMVMRLCRRDAMSRRFEPALPSYWVKRDPPGPAEGSFRDMF